MRGLDAACSCGPASRPRLLPRRRSAAIGPLKWALRVLGLVAALALAACTSAGGAPASEYGPLRVSLVEDYFWPAPAEIGGEAGAAEIDVFPLVTALVVQRRDGRPLGPGDEAASRDAARAYCRDRGLRFPSGSQSRLSDGAWAFPACAGN